MGLLEPRTNYNERLDGILAKLDSYDRDIPAAKSALTQLFKDLVAEANLPNEYQDRLLKCWNENGIDSTS